MPVGFYHPKTRTHVRLLGPCFKTGRMKSYDRQQPWYICALFPSTAYTSSNALRAVRYGRIQTDKERGQPKRACTATPLSGPNSPPRAITLAGASHLLTRLFAWSQQLLTHAAKKCDGPQKKANADGLFGSVQHLQLLQPTWISTTHC